ncbi:MCE family protein, partial [bacterium]
MSVPFRERNPVKVGAISLAVLIGLLVVAFQAGNLPVIGSGDTYYAHFSEAGGIKPNNEVRMAGVRVGKVTAVDLDGDQVKVTFKIDTKTRFGDESRAEIKVKTLLGSMFLSLVPAGSGQMDEGDTIPQSRTQSAFDVVQAFTGTAERVQDIDIDKLSKSFDTLSEATANTPDAFKSALKGVSALSRNVAARDAELNTLLKNLHKVSGTLAERDDDIVALMKDADVLLRALVARRESIHRLLVSTSTLSKELTTLVQQTRGDLKPALADLDAVVDTLLKNQKNLDDSLRLMAPFYRVFTNVLGSGPW